MNSRILPFLAIMISIGIFFAYVNPTWTGSIGATKLAIKNDNDALAAASQYTARENQLAAEQNAIDPASLARLSTLLPDSVDDVGLILDVNALAARSGLLLSNIDAAASPNSTASGAPSSGDPSGGSVNPIGSVDLTLSAVGTYTALQTFLKGIETSARLLDVQNIQVTGSNTGVYNYQMHIRIYWLQ